jgi:transcription antitermination factor NusG
VYTRREKWVAEALRTAGYEVCLPLQSDLRRWSDRRRLIEWPIFLGYVFCSFDGRDRVPIVQTPGVLEILGNGGKAIPLEAEEVQALRVLERAKAQVDPWPYLKTGDWVVIEGGPLDGLTGIIKDSRKSVQLIVSVGLLQRSVAVEIDRAFVRLAARGQGAGSLASSSRRRTPALTVLPTKSA